jgi:hypothetical protein
MMCLDAAKGIHDHSGQSGQTDQSGQTGPYNRAVAELLFGTAAKESNLLYSRQLSPRFDSNAGGFGLWQVELATARYLLAEFVRGRVVEARCHEFLFGRDTSVPTDWAHKISDDRLAGMIWRDARLGVVLARLKYLSIPAVIPSNDSRVEREFAHGIYWLRYYNGYGCNRHHTRDECVDQYVTSYQRLCLPVITEVGYD